MCESHGIMQSFDSVRFLNKREDVEQIIFDMIEPNGLLRNIPKYPSLVSVRTKRRMLYDVLARKLESFQSTPSGLQKKIETKPKGNMQRFMIKQSLLNDITVNFLEVQARLCPSNNAQFPGSPYRLCSIEFGAGFQRLIEEKVIKILQQDLADNHNIATGPISVAMYVNSHSPLCPLPCPEIMVTKGGERFKNECLGQRVTLGSYYLPFLEEEQQGDDDGHPADWGILNNLLIYKNSYIFGLGRPKNRFDQCSTFLDTADLPSVNCILSFKFKEVGIHNNDKFILYLQAEDKVYYSSVKLNEMESAKTSALEILADDDVMRDNIMRRCQLDKKNIPHDLLVRQKKRAREDDDSSEQPMEQQPMAFRKKK